MAIKWLEHRGSRQFYIVIFLFFSASTICAQSIYFQYFYDDLGRLAKVIDATGNEIDYVYDPVGNLLQIKRGTAPAGTTLAIFSFTPMRGDTGTPVTIQGQAFGTSFGANNVQFNGTAATVVSATATNITVLVPDGAATGPISVTVGANTVTSTLDFTIAQVPIIASLSRKSALFNTVVNNLTVTGSNLLSTTFSFQNPAIGVGAASTPTDTSATLNLVTGSIAGTFGLVASSTLGNSTTAITKSNRFTVVDPASKADTDGDGIPDALEALYGTDPLDATSFPTLNQIMPAGEADSVVASVLNTEPPTGVPSTVETDATVFSVLNIGSGKSLPGSVLEADGTIFSLLNTDAYFSYAKSEADSIPFSVSNTAIASKASIKPPTLVDSDGDGYPDALEIALGSDPNDAQSIPQVHPPPEADSTVFSVSNTARTVAAATSK